jgi:hypothetical protein
MRLPHDADGGRDTEECGIGAWSIVTGIKNSNGMALGLDMEQNVYHTQ